MNPEKKPVLIHYLTALVAGIGMYLTFQNENIPDLNRNIIVGLMGVALLGNIVAGSMRWGQNISNQNKKN